MSPEMSLRPDGRPFATPRVAVSGCLEFSACRYDGQRLRDEIVAALVRHVEFVPICPEEEIGLGTPREPIRIVRSARGERLWQPATGRDLTRAMTGHAAARLAGLGDADGFLLKSRSPSCAPRDAKIHAPGERGMALGRGAGLFARSVLAREPDVAVEDEGRLKNLRIREHFYTRLWSYADLRALLAAPSRGALVAFHARHKLLLMAHKQSAMRAMGRLVANPGRRHAADLTADYARAFRAALARPARRGPAIDVLLHALGHVSEGLARAEKRFFLDTLETYRAGRIPLAVPLAIARGWIERYDVDYLRAQSFFEPFPRALVDPSDSARGRDTGERVLTGRR